MNPNVWTTSSFCEAGACVEVEWRRCEGGQCVEVGFRSPCEGGDCVQVDTSGDQILVRDPKNPDQEPISFTRSDWAQRMQQIKDGEPVNLDAWFFPLSFTADELDAFTAGARNGEFDPETT
jgi:hypothetical protein